MAIADALFISRDGTVAELTARIKEYLAGANQPRFIRKKLDGAPMSMASST